MSSPRRISNSTIRRLSAYLRSLETLAEAGVRTVSSSRLAELGTMTPAQVRKDLSVFGNFGVRGRGYGVKDLRRTLRGILGLDRTWKTVVVGAGRLGSALSAYPRFNERGFHIVALFDIDIERSSRRHDDVEVLPVAKLSSWVRENDVMIGVVTTPAAAAQEAADRLVAGGVRGILNFTPASLETPARVTVRNVNMTVELEGLSFAIHEADRSEEGAS